MLFVFLVSVSLARTGVFRVVNRKTNLVPKKFHKISSILFSGHYFITIKTDILTECAGLLTKLSHLFTKTNQISGHTRMKY